MRACSLESTATVKSDRAQASPRCIVGASERLRRLDEQRQQILRDVDEISGGFARALGMPNALRNASGANHALLDVATTRATLRRLLTVHPQIV
jgi:hypothetical protein